MRTIDELTLYAHGLLEAADQAALRAHVDGCAACADRVAELRREKTLLERAARREPVPLPATRRRSMVPLGLAALLLVGLAGVLLYRPAAVDVPGDAGRKGSVDAIDRLVAELKSPVALRRETAAFAITAYGQAAASKVQKATVDPALFPGVRWREQDPKVLEILRKTRLDLSFENARVDTLLQAIGEKIRLTIEVDAKGDPRWDPSKTITFKVKDLTVENSLKLLGSQFGLQVFAEDGKVILSPSRHPGQARAPIRVGNRAASAGAFVQALESPSEDERTRAARELERLNFAAESELWAGLEAPIAHARETCARLLRRLYDEKQAWTPPSSSAAVKAALREKRLSCDFENAPLVNVADYWRELHQVSVHLVGVADPHVSVTFKGEDVTLFEALTLALEPLGLGFAVRESVILISPKDQIATFRPGAPLWSPAAESARIEALIEALGSRDPDGRRTAEQGFLEMGERALPALGEALRLLDLPLASQARALRDRLLQEQKLWLLDAGGQTLSDDQSRRLAGKVTCSVAAVPAGEFLVSTAKTLGVRLDVRTALSGKVTFTLQDVPLAALLRALTLPHGLDFYLDGDTIVVDTAARVRAAVEK